jgi:glucose uptake protein
MILPTTYTSGLLLLLVSFVCFGLWINTFKAAGPRWRFELYSIDFALGFVILSVVAAFTLGTLGSDLAFSDRLLVAGRASQAFVATSGFLFSLGNMLLLAAVGLLGISGALPISIGVALVITSLFSFRSTNTLYLIGGMALLLISVWLDALACQVREAAQKRPAAAAKQAATAVSGATSQAQTGARVASKSTLRAPVKPNRRKSPKGILISVLSGLILGFFYPVGMKGMTGDLALGPYAGLLMFAIGVLLSTVIFDFYFLNIALDGPALSPSAYLEGKARQHLLGFTGGALWAGGALAALLAMGIPAQSGLNYAFKFWLPLASVVLALASGALAWNEFKGAPLKAHISLSWTAALFVLGLSLIGMAANI